MKKWESIENKLIPIAAFAVILVIWQMTVKLGYIAEYILPAPLDIGITFFRIIPDLKVHILTTIEEAMIGFLLSIVLAILLAVLMDGISIVRKAIYPLLVVSQTIPIIALAPLFVMWFGFEMLPKVIIVILVCFFPIVVSLLHGLESADKDLLNLMKSMGASPLQIFRMVKFPASLVNFFSGLRIAATYSIMGAVIGEWLGGKSGLGVYMIRVKHSYAYDKVFAVILVIAILSMLLFEAISIIEYFSMPWSREKSK